jgi:Flp pilus assembly protein TadB
MISLVFGLFSGGIPYFAVQFRVQQYRHKIAKNMITAIQNLIGHYRHSMTLMDLVKVSSSTMPVAIRGEWRRLELALTIRSHKEALAEFERRVDNRWVDDLVELLDLFASYGTNIHEGLRKLAVKMQTSKKNEETRIAVVTSFRIGTVFMAGFAVFAIIFNIYADGSNYGAYFISPFGRLLVAGSFIVIGFFLVFVARIGKRSF